MKEYNKILAALKSNLQLAEGEVAAVYFLGIGGIGMSALARYFKSLGVDVSGYDKTPTALTNQLSAEDIKIHYEDNIDLVDKTLGSFVTSAWQKYKVILQELRVKHSDPFLGEYFQWLAEYIRDQMEREPRKPFYETHKFNS